MSETLIVPGLQEIIRDKSELEKLFTIASIHGITKRQIGIVIYGKNWRNIYKARDQNARIVKRNKKIAEAIYKIVEANNGW